MAAPTHIYIKVSDVMNKRVRIWTDQVAKFGVDGIVMQTHHVQIAQIRYAGANVRMLVVDNILCDRLCRVGSINEFAALKMELTEQLNRLIVVFG